MLVFVDLLEYHHQLSSYNWQKHFRENQHDEWHCFEGCRFISSLLLRAVKATKYESKHLFSASNFMLWRLQWNRRCLKITRHLSENWKLLHLTQFNIEFWLEYFKLALTSCMRPGSEIARNSQTFTSLTYHLRHLSSITQSGNILQGSTIYTAMLSYLLTSTIHYWWTFYTRFLSCFSSKLISFIFVVHGQVFAWMW